MKENADKNEELYIVARILEASAKSEDADDATERAVVYARAAELSKKGQDSDKILNILSKDASKGAERAVENLRLAVEEIEENGTAALTEKADDAVVARLRSEYESG
jgi:delta 1-pyrroline-5-carboxylate dehydrogenase